jgi:anti-sigma-K factor RskA
VRGLVDKMETIEHIDQRSQRRMLLWIVAAALVAVVVLGIVVSFSARRPSDVPVVIESAKPSSAPAGQAPARR